MFVSQNSERSQRWIDYLYSLKLPLTHKLLQRSMTQLLFLSFDYHDFHLKSIIVMKLFNLKISVRFVTSRVRADHLHAAFLARRGITGIPPFGMIVPGLSSPSFS